MGYGIIAVLGVQLTPSKPIPRQTPPDGAIAQWESACGSVAGGRRFDPVLAPPFPPTACVNTGCPHRNPRRAYDADGREIPPATVGNHLAQGLPCPGRGAEAVLVVHS